MQEKIHFARKLQYNHSNHGKVYFWRENGKNRIDAGQNVENLLDFISKHDFSDFLPAFSTKSFQHFQHAPLLKSGFLSHFTKLKGREFTLAPFFRQSIQTKKSLVFTSLFWEIWSIFYEICGKLWKYY